jgi:phosphoglycerate dehydrogenase-like enzyme
MPLLVLAAPDTAELCELEGLPDALRPPLGVGKCLADFEAAGLTGADLATVDVLLTCGVGANAASAETLRLVFAACPHVKWVHSCSAGVNHCLFPDLVNSDVPLTNARGVYSASLAEWALLSCLYFAKDLPRLMAAKADCRWAPYDVEELRGKTLGVVGYGDIGRQSAVLAKAFGMTVLALKRTAVPGAGGDGVASAFYAGRDGLHQMLAACDYILMATPLTPGTQGLLGATEFAALRKNCVFINLGRGACIDEPALIQALSSRAIRGAALDVFATEPLPASSPLWTLPNVLLSPHCADRTASFQHGAMRAFVANAQRYASGQELLSLVDKRAGY